MGIVEAGKGCAAIQVYFFIPRPERGADVVGVADGDDPLVDDPDGRGVRLVPAHRQDRTTMDKEALRHHCYSCVCCWYVLHIVAMWSIRAIQTSPVAIASSRNLVRVPMNPGRPIICG